MEIVPPYGKYKPFKQSRKQKLTFYDKKPMQRNTQAADWAKLFKGRWWLSGFPTPPAGVAICLSHRLCAHQVSFKEIYKGHLISVEFLYNTQNIVILNVYAPSDPMERKIFFSTLRESVKLWIKLLLFVLREIFTVQFVL